MHPFNKAVGIQQRNAYGTQNSGAPGCLVWIISSVLSPSTCKARFKNLVSWQVLQHSAFLLRTGLVHAFGYRGTTITFLNTSNLSVRILRSLHLEPNSSLSRKEVQSRIWTEKHKGEGKHTTIHASGYLQKQKNFPENT